MKTLFALTVFLASSLACANNGPEDIARVSVGRLDLLLTRSGSEIRCSTKGIADHRINVPGMKSLVAPFAHERVRANCEKPVAWRTEVHRGTVITTCYQFGRVPLLDDIVRMCTSI